MMPRKMLGMKLIRWKLMLGCWSLLPSRTNFSIGKGSDVFSAAYSMLDEVDCTRDDILLRRRRVLSLMKRGRGGTRRQVETHVLSGSNQILEKLPLMGPTEKNTESNNTDNIRMGSKVRVLPSSLDPTRHTVVGCAEIPATSTETMEVNNPHSSTLEDDQIIRIT
ncbi:hypothetical protein GH714_003783 [Hevea brasiliensis]|uniref:Uncharacterized protein n=1 Tax=Hevea brasiliensis TaxID=3981 RepID=A0A6A6MC69_HEVBR|nr:hypothetical protein GH714_003783 [Hevea brasiliensis]